MIRFYDQASRRSKAKPSAGHGGAVPSERGPAKKVGMVIMGRLTTGRRDGCERGLGIPAGINDGVTRAGRRQRRHRSDEVGESRWSEGRQGIGVQEGHTT